MLYCDVDNNDKVEMPDSIPAPSRTEEYVTVGRDVHTSDLNDYDASQVELFFSQTGSVMLSGYPSCCGVLIASNLHGPDIPKVIEYVLEIAHLWEYSQVQYVTADWQKLLEVHLKAAGFKPVFVGENVRSGYTLTTFVKEIEYAEEC